MQFKAADPASLAAAMRGLAEDAALYQRLSEGAPAALERLYIGLEWAELVNCFLNDPKAASGWVAENAFDRIEPAIEAAQA